MNLLRRKALCGAASILVGSSLEACVNDYSMGGRMRQRQYSAGRMYEKTQWMCFGRYAVNLPKEAEQVFGFQTIDAGFKEFKQEKYPGPAEVLREEWKKAIFRNRSASLIEPIRKGPTSNAMEMFFYWNDAAKADDSRLIYGAIQLGQRIYLYEGMSDLDEQLPANEVLARMTTLMRGMRAWDGVEVPREPGVCIDGAFIHEPTHRFQEIMSSGFYFPSLPDVSFSVSSNKNASTDGPNGRGLLESVEMARGNPLLALVGGYPYTYLRKGKRTLHGLWDGEEIVSRSNRDHALRFEWGMVGQTGNPARPAHLEVSMSTRVANNRVGASATTSLSDEEAVALWDRLLEGVKFRVAVPGATPQSVALR